MTYKEAIKEAKIQIDAYENMISYCKYFEPKEDTSKYEYKIEFLKTTIKALKKQTTEYKHIGTRLTYWGKYKYIFKCETCGLTKEFTDNHTAQYKFCPSCGREIDWSSKPKGNDCDFMFIDEVIAYDTQKED